MFYPLELLAPAGTIDVFSAAVESGADAIYIGAPAANARALAKQFSLEEIAAMISFAHGKGVKVYAAMNSLIKHEEFSQMIELLSVFEGIGIDALIVQDLGLFYLAQKYFPNLRLHASTLLGAHNSLAVRQFAEMGFKRVVLAREMSIEEIRSANQSREVEIEVFVHGAMCFSFSGLCLFSSYLGGKSGLRGRCVQPCRRKYTWKDKVKGKSSSYLFSMNDMEGITLLDALADAGVRSIKIEGRMRSRQYVENVVKAYRLILDHGTNKDAIKEAQHYLDNALSRKTAKGYFVPGHDDSLISHHHSGNIGGFLGRLQKVKNKLGFIKLNDSLQVEDRLRIHFESNGERSSFTLKKITSNAKEVTIASKDQIVSFIVPDDAKINDLIYKIDTRKSRKEGAGLHSISGKEFKKIIVKERRRQRIKKIIEHAGNFYLQTNPVKKIQTKDGRFHRKTTSQKRAFRASHSRFKSTASNLPWWLKVDDLRVLRYIPPDIRPANIIILLTKETSRQLKHSSLANWQRKHVIWSLPPLIFEEDLGFYFNKVKYLAENGFINWQVSHIFQLQLFKSVTAAMNSDDVVKKLRKKTKTKKVKRTFPGFNLCGHYTLNVLNQYSLEALNNVGIDSNQIAVEADIDVIGGVAKLCNTNVGFTVYGYPALFTSKASPSFFHYNKRFESPKKEEFILKKKHGQTLALPVEPFSILDRRGELKNAGIDYCVVDLSNAPTSKKELSQLWLRLSDKLKRYKRLSAFNYRIGLL